MQSLQGPKEDFEIEIIDGIKFTCRPRGYFDLAVAEASARRLLERLEDSTEICVEAGLLEVGTFVDLKSPAQREALFHIFTVQQFALRVIKAWEGIEGASEINEATVRAVMAVWPPGGSLPIGEVFFRKYMEHYRRLDEAKKGLATDASGISSPAPVATTAKDARKRGRHVRPAARGSTGVAALMSKILFFLPKNLLPGTSSGESRN